jgi:hypothetical protein
MKRSPEDHPPPVPMEFSLIAPSEPHIQELAFWESVLGALMALAVRTESWAGENG